MLLCLMLTGVENIFKSLFIGLERVQYTACSEVGEQLIRIFAVSFLLYEYGSGDYGRIAMLIFAGMVCSEIFSALSSRGCSDEICGIFALQGRIRNFTVSFSALPRHYPPRR